MKFLYKKAKQFLDKATKKVENFFSKLINYGFCCSFNKI